MDDTDPRRTVPLLRFAEPTHTGCRFLEVAGFQFALCHEVFLFAFREVKTVKSDPQSLCSARRTSAARSPIVTQVAMVLPVVTRGIVDPSE